MADPMNSHRLSLTVTLGGEVFASEGPCDVVTGAYAAWLGAIVSTTEQEPDQSLELPAFREQPIGSV